MTASETADLDDPAWAGEDEQPLRPYAITGGRTRPRYTMRLVSLLVAGHTLPQEVLAPEAEAAFVLCRSEQRSVAEIAARLRQPVQVTKIILSDLIDSGALVMAVPDTTCDPDKTVQLVEAVLAGLQHKFANVV
jgi:Protein of unknown function (DUF742)